MQKKFQTFLLSNVLQAEYPTLINTVQDKAYVHYQSFEAILTAT
ncbi:hypothetical protein [Acinetobacter sp. ANC 4648]|nr:hypothetical protein [Acinetobacter sp. ANC 4648]